MIDMTDAADELNRLCAERDALAAEAAMLRDTLGGAISESCKCEGCGESGVRYFTTEGDGPFWLCDKVEIGDDAHGDHAMPERYAGEEVETPDRPLDAARAALASPSRAAEWQRAREDCIRAEMRVSAERLAFELFVRRTDDQLDSDENDGIGTALRRRDERMRRAALEEAIKKCEAEADAYAASVREMDAAGQTKIGTAETRAVLACRRCADEIRAIATRAPEPTKTVEMFAVSEPKEKP